MGGKMDFIDYREKLGLGFNDNQKFALLKTKVFNMITPESGESSFFQMSVESYFDFCNLTGSEINFRLTKDHSGTNRFADCVHVIRDHSDNLQDFLSYYISMANCLPVDVEGVSDRKYMKNIIISALNTSHIQFTILNDNEEFFILPKGAKELDGALVSEPLDWLSNYPQSRKTFCIALKQYSDGIYIRDVADNLRKSLEEFLQEFLGNTKNLETNKSEICRHLGMNGVSPEFCGLLQPLLNTYKTINDKYAKHHDAIDKKLLEFLLYQTGIFIRMIISAQ